MLKTSLTVFVLPLVLLLGSSSDNSASAEAQGGWMQRAAMVGPRAHWSVALSRAVSTLRARATHSLTRPGRHGDP